MAFKDNSLKMKVIKILTPEEIVVKKDRRSEINKEKARIYRKNNAASIRYKSCRGRAEKKTLGYSTQDEFISWFNSQIQICHYCGITNYLHQKWMKQKTHTSLEIDRKNNSKGYTINNIVLACRRCNMAKNCVFSYNEFVKIANRYLRPKATRFIARYIRQGTKKEV